MSGLALALVLAAAVVHAAWNYKLKKSGGGLAFVWLFGVLACVLYAPFAVWLAWRSGFVPDPAQLGLIAASALLHTVYYLLLDRGYRVGDLSLVYPLARATGPLLTVVVAVSLLGERPSALGLAGGAVIVLGAVLLTGDPRRMLRAHGVGVRYALLTGALIASYTVVDSRAVAQWLVPPLLLDWGANVGRALLLAPLAWRDRPALARAWREQRPALFTVAVLCPLAYILVLTAMGLAPVSYVAPARELSILVAAFLGTHWLAEPDAGRRLFGAGIMASGVIFLALG